MLSLHGITSARIGFYAILLGLLFVGISTHSLSQGSYVQIGGGYGFSSDSHVIGGNTNTTEPAASYEGVFGSYGEGFKFGFTGGTMFTKNLGAEVGVMYLSGKTYEVTGTFTRSNSIVKSSGTELFFTPSFVVALPMQGFTPYAKLGLLIGIPKVKTENTFTITSGAGAGTTSQKEEDLGGLALGYTGGVGAAFAVGGNFGFFAEIMLISGSWSPSKNELTDYTVNGTSKLAEATDRNSTNFQRDKSIQYKDVFIPGQLSALGRSTGPRLSVRHPFGSLGVNVGIRVTI